MCAYGRFLISLARPFSSLYRLMYLFGVTVGQADLLLAGGRRAVRRGGSFMVAYVQGGRIEKYSF